jgi:hypothetical protein
MRPECPPIGGSGWRSRFEAYSNPASCRLREPRGDGEVALHSDRNPPEIYPRRLFRVEITGLSATLLLTGCANSGPVPIGPDTYMMANTSAWNWSSGAALQGDLYREARAFCAASGKRCPTETRNRTQYIRNPEKVG